MRKILIALLILLVPAAALPWGGSMMIMSGGSDAGGGGGGSCNMGYETEATTDGGIGESAEVMQLYTASCSGTLDNAYLYHHIDGGIENARICVYLDDGDNAPDSGDTKVACSGVITSTATTA